MRRFVTGLSALALSMGVVLVPHAFAQPKPSITVLSPKAGETITSTDIPVTVQVSNFNLSPADVGLPDKAGEGHIHVMLDGMNMGVLFNFYTSTTFTLLGQSMKPGQHALTFDLERLHILLRLMGRPLTLERSIRRRASRSHRKRLARSPTTVLFTPG